MSNDSLTSMLDAQPFELTEEQKAPLFELTCRGTRASLRSQRDVSKVLSEERFRPARLEGDLTEIRRYRLGVQALGGKLSSVASEAIKPGSVICYGRRPEHCASRQDNCAADTSHGGHGRWLGLIDVLSASWISIPPVLMQPTSARNPGEGLSELCIVVTVLVDARRSVLRWSFWSRTLLTI